MNVVVRFPSPPLPEQYVGWNPLAFIFEAGKNSKGKTHVLDWWRSLMAPSEEPVHNRSSPGGKGLYHCPIIDFDRCRVGVVHTK